MNKNIKNILREKVILKKLKGFEFFIKILKSIKQNNNINCNIKNYTNRSAPFTKIHVCKKKKICFLSGKHGGFLGLDGFSRYVIKGLILQNKFNNLKKKNW